MELFLTEVVYYILNTIMSIRPVAVITNRSIIQSNKILYRRNL